MSALLVVGGGPAGLATAQLAAEGGHDVTLVEAANRFGGMAASIEVSGQRVDLGSHRLHPAASRQAMAFLQRLLGDDLQVRRRNGRIVLGGHAVAFPLDPVDLARSLPPRFALAAGRDALLAPIRTPRDDSYAEAIRAGLGPAVLDWFYGPYAHKLWGCDPAALSRELAERRVSASSVVVIAKKLLTARREGGATFLYPRLGYGQIVEEMEAAARVAGARLVPECRVTSLVDGPDGVEVATADGQVTGRFDRVFWTAPPEHLASLALDAAVVDAAVVDAAVVEGVPVRAMVLVYLTLDQDQYTPYDAHYLPQRDVPVSRLSEPKNYRHGPDPAGQTVLCAEVPCDRGDEIWRASSAQLSSLVVDALASVGLPIVEPTSVHVEHLDRVYPVITRASAAQRQGLLAALADLESVTVLGRQALIVGDNLHHVLDMALAAVACLGEGGEWDRPQWQRSLDRFEAHVVED